MDNIHLPSVEKKRAEAAKARISIRNILVRPKTWKTVLSALDLFLKLARMVQRVWDWFQ